MKTIITLSVISFLLLHCLQGQTPVKLEPEAQFQNLGSSGNTDFNLVTGDKSRLTIKSNGNVGIGTSTPSEKLEINGSVKFSQLKGQGQRPLYVDEFGKLITLPPFAKSGQGGDTTFGCQAVRWAGDGNTVSPSCFIGTLNPVALRMYAGGQEWMKITANGRVGIRTFSPVSDFQVGYSFPLIWSKKINQVQGNVIDRRMIGINAHAIGVDQIATVSNGPSAGLDFDGLTGILQIGVASQGDKTWTAGLKLYPNGNALLDGVLCSREVKVRLQANPCWPDYVFEKDYDLLPLSELSKYIETEGHLPGIPKANEVEKEGIELGEMNRKLLEKVEELTLYMIELKKENEALQSRVEKLEEE